VLAALAAGQLPTGDAVHIVQAISQQARVTEIDELEQRVRKLVAERN